MFVIHAKYAGNPATTVTTVGRAITLLNHRDTSIPFAVEIGALEKIKPLLTHKPVLESPTYLIAPAEIVADACHIRE